MVAAAVDGTTGALIEINCETDFVSKNESFLSFAKAAASLMAQHSPADVAALSALAYAQEGFGPTLEDVRRGLIGKIGENMSIRRFKRYSGGGKLASYLHGTRIGVMVEFDGSEDPAKAVAMHVAALKPAALSQADVPARVIDAEMLRTVFAVRAVVGTDPVTGSVSVTPVLREGAVAAERRGRVHVIGGSGVAAPLLRRLVLAGWEVKAPLHHQTQVAFFKGLLRRLSGRRQKVDVRQNLRDFQAFHSIP